MQRWDFNRVEMRLTIAAEDMQQYKAAKAAYETAPPDWRATHPEPELPSRRWCIEVDGQWRNGDIATVSAKYGHSGWELISVVPEGRDLGVITRQTLYFKRPIED